jgi:hypothetical protein
MANFKKGYILRKDNNSKLTFQYNPTTLDYGRTANYSIKGSPGMNYPKAQYISGSEKAFSVELFLFGKNTKNNTIPNDVNFILALFPGETNKKTFTKPPEFIYCQGNFVKRCVATSYNIHIEEIDKNGKATNVTITLGLLQVGVS